MTQTACSNTLQPMANALASIVAQGNDAYADIDAEYAAGARSSKQPLRLYTRQLWNDEECDAMLAAAPVEAMTPRTISLVYADGRATRGIQDEAAACAMFSIVQSFPANTLGPSRKLRMEAEKAAEAWRVTLSRGAPPLIIRYESPSGGMAWHPDRYGPDKYVLSATVQLSDDKDYEGGDLIVCNEQRQWTCAPRGRGTVTIFPSQYWHCIKPVTRSSLRKPDKFPGMAWC